MYTLSWRLQSFVYELWFSDEKKVYRLGNGCFIMYKRFHNVSILVNNFVDF